MSKYLVFQQEENKSILIFILKTPMQRWIASKRKIAEEDWDNYDRYVNYFQDFIVKEIDIHLWDWGTRKKIE